MPFLLITAYEQTIKQTNKQTNKQVNKQVNKQTNKQTKTRPVISTSPKERSSIPSSRPKSRHCSLTTITHSSTLIPAKTNGFLYPHSRQNDVTPHVTSLSQSQTHTRSRDIISQSQQPALLSPTPTHYPLLSPT